MEATGPSSSAVFVTRAPRPDYGLCALPTPVELPGYTKTTSALIALRHLLSGSGLDAMHFDTPEWNPLADLIRAGDRVVIKPNWVLHRNGSGGGMDCLVTHPSVIEAILHYAVKARPGRIVVGDAPVQGCDFDALMAACGVANMIDRFASRGLDVTLRDFRRTALPGGRVRRQKQPTERGLDQYVLFDLGADSALEAISSETAEFRVTMYDPEALRRTHGPGKHQYLVARETIEADVVINVPKLKTHKKAGLTGALKNVVGINGQKDYLPHHRKGGSAGAGDCYEGRDRLKGWIESWLDSANRSEHIVTRYLYSRAASLGIRAGRLLGQHTDVEGSWHGNDTVWRTCLDLMRILHYGRRDGSLAAVPQRRVLTVTDAIVAGEGDGPLAPDPVPLGLMTLGTNVAALEWVHALLMGFDPRSIPLTREAFTPRSYPLAMFSPERISVRFDGRPTTIETLVERHARPFRPPRGWVGACECREFS